MAESEAGAAASAEHPVPLQERVKFLAAVQEVARQDVAQCVARFGLPHLLGKSPGIHACRPPQPLVVDASGPVGVRPAWGSRPRTRPAAGGPGHRAPGPRPQPPPRSTVEKQTPQQSRRDPKLASALLRQQRTATEDMKSDFAALRREVETLAGALQQAQVKAAPELRAQPAWEASTPDDPEAARARRRARRQARAERQAEEALRAREAVRRAVGTASREDRNLLAQAVASAAAAAQQTGLPSPPPPQRQLLRSTATSPLKTTARSEGTSPHIPVPVVQSVGVSPLVFDAPTAGALPGAASGAPHALPSLQPVASPAFLHGGASPVTYDTPAASAAALRHTSTSPMSRGGAASPVSRSPAAAALAPQLRHSSTSPLIAAGRLAMRETAPRAEQCAQTSPLLRACDEEEPASALATATATAAGTGTMPAPLSLDDESDEESATTDSSLYLPAPVGASGFADVLTFNAQVDGLLAQIQQWDSETEAAFRSNEAVLRAGAENAARLARDSPRRSKTPPQEAP
eukprot:Hpha_TRINITY_DN34411_c0_g1::TRINITY_DN34411_c0_g1_i1::g.96103::m.96103